MSRSEGRPAPELIQRLIADIRTLASTIGRRVRLMEVCGTHTMAIYRAGIPSLLPENIRLLSGPGCPVCVTPMGYLDAAIEIARRPGITLATFGDMIKVPGSNSSLEQERARGAEVRVVYSPLDALRLAEERLDRTVVFLGVGFETTAPATAVTLSEARRRRLRNFLVLCAHKVVPAPLRALLNDPAASLDGLILPGHVSVILGSEPYRFIAEEFRRAAVITGFEPTDVLQSIRMLLLQISENAQRVEIQYSHVVRPDGNPVARRAIAEHFEQTDTEWRGLGRLPRSGLRIRDEFSAFDAERVLGVRIENGREPPGCRCGEVLRGAVEPEECALFGTRCTPMTPVGACMVSSEGTCAAHFRYGSADRR